MNSPQVSLADLVVSNPDTVCVTILPALVAHRQEQSGKGCLEPGGKSAQGGSFLIALGGFGSKIGAYRLNFRDIKFVSLYRIDPGSSGSSGFQRKPGMG